MGIVLVFSLAAVVAAQELPVKPVSLENATPASASSTAWTQVNNDGFGNKENHGITSLSSFSGYIYAGTGNDSGTGAQLWRSNDGETWTVISNNGLGDTDNGVISHSIEFNGMLYAGVGNEVDGGRIYRSSNGTAWTQVTLPGFNPTNIEIVRFAVFNGHIYAGTYTGETPAHGAEIWRSSTGNSGDWTQVVSDGFNNDVENKYIIALYVYNDYLYAGTDNWSGTEIWRSNNGTDWTQVNLDGFGDTFNWSVALEFFKGYLYAGTYNYFNSDNPGCELWRCILCDGSDWEHITSVKSFGDTENRSIRSLEIFDGFLYAVTYNATSGMEVWRTQDGTSWMQVNIDGFGDSQNRFPHFDNSITAYKNNLYVGTWNRASGGELWQSLWQIYLPIVTH
jgi:hypothetical protein